MDTNGGKMVYTIENSSKHKISHSRRELNPTKSLTRIKSSTKTSKVNLVVSNNIIPANQQQPQPCSSKTVMVKQYVHVTGKRKESLKKTASNIIPCRCRNGNDSSSEIMKTKSLTRVTRVGSKLNDNTDKLTAKQRVYERNRLKVFEDTEMRLAAIQSEFMHKYEDIKYRLPNRIKKEYKFVAMAVNGQCNLVFSSDDVRRMPHKLPAKSVEDFKQIITSQMEKAFNNCWNIIINAHMNDEVRHACLDKLRQLQEDSLLELNKAVDKLCSCKDDIIEADRKKIKFEVQQARNCMRTFNQTLFELQKKHKAEISKLEAKFQEKDAVEQRNRSQISELQRKLRSSQKDNERLIYRLNALDERAQAMSNNESKSQKGQKSGLNLQLKAQLNEAKKTIEELCLHNINDLNSPLPRLKKDLADCRVMLKISESDKEVLCAKLNEIKTNYERATTRLMQQNQEIEYLRNKIHWLSRSDQARTNVCNPAETEVEKLRSNEVDLHRQINILQNKLEKALEYINNLEHQNQLDRRIFRIQDKYSELSESESDANIEHNVELPPCPCTARQHRSIIRSLQEHIREFESMDEHNRILRARDEEKIENLTQEINYLNKMINDYQKQLSGIKERN